MHWSFNSGIQNRVNLRINPGKELFLIIWLEKFLIAICYSVEGLGYIQFDNGQLH